MALAYLPGGMELGRKFAADHGGHTREHDEIYKIAGILREMVWIQPSPPGSGFPDLKVVSIETNDIGAMFKQFATSDHPWAVRFREFAVKAFGLDFSGPLPPLNENTIDWKDK